MKSTVSIDIDRQMAQDVLDGLSAPQKYLSSRYFYDDAGSKLFQQIMRMESYYPTDCEYEIFDQQSADMASLFTQAGDTFRLIEFGAGDGLKTKLFLHHLLATETPHTYMPIDISEGAIDRLTADLRAEMPALSFQAVVGDYFDALHRINEMHGAGHKVILFLGGNIGNFSHDEAVTFLQGIAAEMSPQDQLMIGFDLKKEPRTVLSAYDDSEGITRDFNLNLLRRFNRELGADFCLDYWQHYATYDPISGETKSYLMSEREQHVHIKALNQSFQFAAWEPVWTELSQKYDFGMIESLAKDAGFRVLQHFTDSRTYFVDSVWGRE